MLEPKSPGGGIGGAPVTQDTSEEDEDTSSGETEEDDSSSESDDASSDEGEGDEQEYEAEDSGEQRDVEIVGKPELTDLQSLEQPLDQTQPSAAEDIAVSHK